MTSDVEKLRERWCELASMRSESPSLEIVTRMNLLDLSHLILERNYVELSGLLASIKNDLLPEGLSPTEMRDSTSLRIIEVNQRLINYLATGGSLDEHMEKLYKNFYKNEVLLKDFYKEREARILNDALARLARDLRNYTIHHRHPIVIHSQNTRYTGTGEIRTCSILLEKSHILEFDRIDPHTVAFLASQLDRIDLSSVIGPYHLHLGEYYRWFLFLLNTIHAAEISEIRDIEQEMAEIDAATHGP